MQTQQQPQTQNQQQCQEDPEMCAICLDPITHDYIQPKCKHQFHYGCMHSLDMAHREQVFKEYDEEDIYYPTVEEFKDLFEAPSMCKDILDYCDEEDPLCCPLCRGPVTIRSEKIQKKKKSTSLGKIIKPQPKSEYLRYWIIHEPRRGEKFKSEKRSKNYKMTHRRFNK